MLLQKWAITCASCQGLLNYIVLLLVYCLCCMYLGWLLTFLFFILFSKFTLVFWNYTDLSTRFDVAADFGPVGIECDWPLGICLLKLPLSKASSAIVGGVFLLSTWFKDLLVDMKKLTKCPFLWKLLQVWWNAGQTPLIWVLPQYLHCFITFLSGCKYLLVVLYIEVIKTILSFFFLRKRFCLHKNTSQAKIS